MNTAAVVTLAESIIGPKVCTVPGCGRVRHSKEHCRMHYERHRRGQVLTAPPYGYTPWGQAVDAALALADSHGTPEWEVRLRLFRDAIDRIRICGYEEIRHGWRKKRSHLRMLKSHARCTVEGCHRAHRSKGLCDKHYQAARYQASKERA